MIEFNQRNTPMLKKAALAGYDIFGFQSQNSIAIRVNAFGDKVAEFFNTFINTVILNYNENAVEYMKKNFEANK